MKTQIRIFLLTLSMITVVLVSCEKVEEPDISDFKADKTIAPKSESIKFTVKSSAEFIVIWTGDLKHNYYNYLDSIAAGSQAIDINRTKNYDSGESLSSETYVGSEIYEYDYTYALSGTYKVIAITSNVGSNGEIRKENIKELTVTITE